MQSLRPLRVFSLLALLLAPCLPALADAPAAPASPVPAKSREELFKTASTEILDRLLEKGLTPIRSLDIQAMRDEAATVQWRALAPGETIPGFASGRTSAYYVRNGKTVTVAADPSVFSAQALSVLALHETLGAIGYDDRFYQLSIALYAYSITNLDNEANRKEREFQKAAFFPLIRMASREEGGGGTRVGGGGDFLGMIMKMQTMLSIWHRPLRPEHYQQFLMIRFEASYADQEPMNRVAFDEQGEPYIVMPAKLWLSKKTFEERFAIARMAELLVQGLFLQQVPKFEPRARVECTEASRPLIFSWIKPIPDLVNGLQFYFRPNKCKIELTTSQ